MTVGAAERLAHRLADGNFGRMWLSYNDPSPTWYKTYSSMAYTIECLPYRRFRLTPVRTRMVYSFDEWGEFVVSARDVPINMMFSGTIDPTMELQIYRARVGPPVVHEIYPLLPQWDFT